MPKQIYKYKITKDQLLMCLEDPTSYNYKSLATNLGYNTDKRDDWNVRCLRWLNKYNLSFVPIYIPKFRICEDYVKFQNKSKNIHYDKNKWIYVDLEDWDKVKKYTWNIHQTKEAKTYYKIYNSTLRLFLHQFVFGKKEGFVIDHINHNTLDNRKHNLRWLRPLINIILKKKTKNHSSRFRGVVKRKNGKFRVCMTINGKQNRFGTYDSEIEAAKVWNSVLKYRLKSLTYLEYYDLCKNRIE